MDSYTTSNGSFYKQETKHFGKNTVTEISTILFIFLKGNFDTPPKLLKPVTKMPGFLEDVQLAQLHQWFVEKEKITFDNAMEALSKEKNISDEIIQKLNAHLKPTATFVTNTCTYQAPSEYVAFNCKECNITYSFMSGFVMHVIVK